MPQAILPLFSSDMTIVNDYLAFKKDNGKVYYFLGQVILFQHDENDHKSFRYITSQLVDNGNAKQMEIVRAFGVSKSSVKRYVKKFRKGGANEIFKKPKVRKAHILTNNTISKIENRLDKNRTIPEIAKELKLKADTIRKAIKAGKIKKNL